MQFIQVEDLFAVFFLFIHLVILVKTTILAKKPHMDKITLTLHSIIPPTIRVKYHHVCLRAE